MYRFDVCESFLALDCVPCTLWVCIEKAQLSLNLQLPKQGFLLSIPCITNRLLYFKSPLCSQVNAQCCFSRLFPYYLSSPSSPPPFLVNGVFLSCGMFVLRKKKLKKKVEKKHKKTQKKTNLIECSVYIKSTVFMTKPLSFLL